MLPSRHYCPNITVRMLPYIMPLQYINKSSRRYHSTVTVLLLPSCCYCQAPTIPMSSSCHYCHDITVQTLPSIICYHSTATHPAHTISTFPSHYCPDIKVRRLPHHASKIHEQTILSLPSHCYCSPAKVPLLLSHRYHPHVTIPPLLS